jgi:HTH-type transcriptional regulator / antitoxin HigA
MDSDARREYEPATVLHPGETVAEYLEFNGWSQRDLARRTGLTPKTISEICAGKAPITPPTALALEKVLQRPAHFWLNLQRQYDEADARRRASAKLHDWKPWAERFPIKEMETYGWLEPHEPRQSKVETLLSFLGVSSPDSWNSVWEASKVAYRQTRRFRTSTEAISAWVRAAEIAASQLEFSFQEFDERGLTSCLTTLTQLTRKKPQDFVPAVQSICASVGVAVVWVPELSHTGISGCARWLADRKALIALTLRYNTDDQIWFTFFHELGHILLHRKQRQFILDNAAENLDDEVVDPEMRPQEEEANRFAADTLIPPDALSRFIRANEFTNAAIKLFADELQIGPGIIVGRLQKEGVLEYFQGNALKQRFHWEFAN